MVTSETKLIRLISCGEVAPGCVVQAFSPGMPPLAVYHLNGEFFVTDDLCSHGDASLADGEVLPDGEIECPFHGGTFDIRTGAARRYPCTVDIKSYPVTIKDDAVWIDAGD
jgi:nitrite reductase/ring-hydroxylating ferredoxin subunit